MKLVVSGAAGFLGRYVVAEALRRGHTVRAMVRSPLSAGDAGWDADAPLEIVIADLRSRHGLPSLVDGDAVIHLAADKSGDIYAQYASTVVGTENLLWAMDQANVRRIVHVSSLAVYDYLDIAGGASHDETAPLEPDALARDDYTRTKLVQERLVRDHASQRGWSWTVLRPGMIIGPHNLWSARIGTQGRRAWIRIGARGRLPITYVENVAEAVLLAAERASAAGQILNVIDDDPPTRRHYVDLLRVRTTPRPHVFTIPWPAVRATARLAWVTNQRLLRSGARLPGMLVPCRVHARFKPLQFSNRKIKSVLGWQPRYGLVEAIDRSVAGAASVTCATAAPRAPARANGLRIAYMTGQYPRATDTFIQREVTALRECGVHVETLSVRRPSRLERITDGAAERGPTHYLVPVNPLRLVAAHAALCSRTPGRYGAALALALATRPPGRVALIRQAIYFLEAGLVAERLRQRHLTHLHNHFADSSCSVAMLAAALGGFSYSFTLHGPADFHAPTYWRVDEKVRRAAFVAVISQFARHHARHIAPQEHWNKLQVIHCGVRPEEFTPVCHDGRGTRLLFVGRLVAAKAVPVLLDAVARLVRDRPQLELVVVGDGPERARIEGYAEQIGIAPRVSFLGYQSPARVRDLLQRTDVFALASSAEGVPVVLMEAMAAGVPVVATRIAGIPELVDDGVCGFLVPPGESRALAEKAAVLLDDAALRNRFGAAGREKIEREFDIVSAAERLSLLLHIARGR